MTDLAQAKPALDLQRLMPAPRAAANSRGRRILLYSATPGEIAGGVQNVVVQLADTLRTRGHTVVERWASGCTAADRDSAPLPLRFRDSSLGWAAPVAALRRLVRCLRASRPEIVNVHFVTGQALYFLALAPFFGYRTILSAHGSDVLRPRHRMKKLLPIALRSADAISVVSDDLRQRVCEISGVNPANVRLIENGVDLRFWGGERAPRKAGPPRIIAVGRLESVKGFDVLIEALFRLRQSGAPARLTIVGEGSERERLERLARDLGLEQVVDLPGQLPPEEVRTRLYEADVFGLSSHSEGVPLALLEAMTTGLPVVATHVGGVPAAMEGGGLLVPPGRPDELASALRRMINDPELAAACGTGARACSSRYGNGRTALGFERLYSEVLAA